RSGRVELFRRASGSAGRLSCLPCELRRAGTSVAPERGRMTADAISSGRLLIGWIAAAVLTLVVSLYFMSVSDQGNATVGPSAYSRSAIGYAGIADVLRQLDIPVVRSRGDSVGGLGPRRRLVRPEPLPGGKTEEAMRTLLKADTVLLVLPKWTG